MRWRIDSIEAQADQEVIITASREIGPGLGETVEVEVEVSRAILDMLVHLGTHVVSLEDRGILPPGREGL